jgi:hypothetical protein
MFVMTNGHNLRTKKIIFSRKIAKYLQNIQPNPSKIGRNMQNYVHANFREFFKIMDVCKTHTFIVQEGSICLFICFLFRMPTTAF